MPYYPPAYPETNVYRTRLVTQTRISTAATSTASPVYFVIQDSTDITGPAATTATGAFPFLHHSIAADEAVPGFTSKIMLKVAIACGATPSAITYTFGLYPVTISAATFAVGTLVPSSTAAVASPAASTITPAAMVADIALPADGFYAVGIVLSGATNPASSVQAFARVLTRSTSP